jgi:choice-of-anchor A domain-containing protein
MLRRWHNAVLVLLIAAASPHASSYLYAASSYNVLVRNNFSDFNTDTEGGDAAGGRISTTGSIGFASLNPGLPYFVVAAIDFTATGSGSIQGNLCDGTAGGINSSFTVNGTITSDGGNTANSPIDFSTAFTKLGSLSTSLGAMAATSGDSCTNY